MVILKKIQTFFENRTGILSIIILGISVIYIIGLINLQIVNGSEYREKSEKKMLRTVKVEAARGEGTDRNGVVLFTNKLSYDVIIYRTSSDENIRNEGFLNLYNILSLNNEEISLSFPINKTLNGFSFSTEEESINWKKNNKIDETYNFEQTIEYYIKKYSLENYEKEDAIKIILIRYECISNNYSLFKSITISSNVSEKTVALIEEQKNILPGVETKKTPTRYYPNNELLAHVIGYVSKISKEELKVKNNNESNEYNINSLIGKSGIEKLFEEYLKGKDGLKRVEVDLSGNVSDEKVVEEPVPGYNMTLTIDYRLQKKAEEGLQKAIKEIQTGTKLVKQNKDAKAGAIVALDANTSEVLAIASYPTYNLNEVNKNWNNLVNDDTNPLFNRAISGKYSPGSTYKMLVGFAGLTNNVITLDEKYTDPGIYPYGHHPESWIYAKYGITHGVVTYETAIKFSVNTYFYEVGRRLGISKIAEMARTYGLGDKTGIELLNESVGTIAGENKEREWYLGDTLNASIGQSDNSFTPVALANYIAALVNGGNLNKVSIIKNIIDENGNEISKDEIDAFANSYTNANFKPKKIDIKQEYIDAAKRGMYAVTKEVGGTSYSYFKTTALDIAGKTGTAEVYGTANNSVFVAFAPYENPKIIVAAVVEKGGEGNYIASAIISVMEEYFNIAKKDIEDDTFKVVNSNNINY